MIHGRNCSPGLAGSGYLVNEEHLLHRVAQFPARFVDEGIRVFIVREPSAKAGEPVEGEVADGLLVVEDLDGDGLAEAPKVLKPGGRQVTGSFFYASMFAYIAGTPFAYITYYHVPEQLYGLLFGLGIIGILVANLRNSHLVLRYNYNRMLRAGTIIAAFAASMVALFARSGWGGLWGLVVPLFVFVSATGFIVVNSITGALTNFPERAGTVSALVGAIQYGSGICGFGLGRALCQQHPLADGRDHRDMRDRQRALHAAAERSAQASCGQLHCGTG